MSVNKATVGAISVSGATLILCLYAISAIYSEVQSIWTELDAEMDSFKVLSDDLWRDMVQMGAATPSTRFRRQSYGGYGASGSNTGGYGGGPSVPAFPGNGGPNGPGPLGEQPKFPGGGNNGAPNNQQCQCKAENTCPEGPAGPAGEAGAAGHDGLPGLPGIPGKDAEDIHNEPPQGCFTCPTGKIIYL